jgi:hypothetical protein
VAQVIKVGGLGAVKVDDRSKVERASQQGTCIGVGVSELLRECSNPHGCRQCCHQYFRLKHTCAISGKVLMCSAQSNKLLEQGC